MCVFTPKMAHNCTHRAHLHTTPLCVFLCVCALLRAIIIRYYIDLAQLPYAR